MLGSVEICTYLNEAESNAPSLKWMHDFWKSWWWNFILFYFLRKMMMVVSFYFWKWMSHGRMPLVWNINPWILKKTWFDQFWKQWCKWWLLKTSELNTLEYPSLIKKYIYIFWMPNGLKKKFHENVKLHGFAWGMGAT